MDGGVAGLRLLEGGGFLLDHGGKGIGFCGLSDQGGLSDRGGPETSRPFVSLCCHTANFKYDLYFSN